MIPKLVIDAIKVEQASAGKWEAPAWDKPSQDKVRDALNVLGSLGGTTVRFGTKTEVGPVSHLIGTVIGWGGRPLRHADAFAYFKKLSTRRSQ
jgi:hypothetical protein